MITVAGGVYRERCIRPAWDQLYGSAGRAAATLSTISDSVTLATCVGSDAQRELEVRTKSWGIALQLVTSDRTVRFEYVHPLSVPLIYPPPHLISRAPAIKAASEVVLRFGMMETTVEAQGRRVVYDPQSAYNPELFRANGSSAESLAIVANAYEVRMLSGEAEPQSGAAWLIQKEQADVVVVKRGSRGALVSTKAGAVSEIPAYESAAVFSIGSGDVFAATFAHFWGERGYAADRAADLASQMTARYCESRSPQIITEQEIASEPPRKALSVKNGRVYLAGPFFSLGQLWMVEEARAHLRGMGLNVFSPIHDVGPGPAEMVAPADLEELDKCDRMLALVDGTDPGTLVEIGFARARNMPVIALAEAVSEENLKMISGSGCIVVDDFVTAIYKIAWV